MRKLLVLIGRSLEERLFTMILTCIVTILAFYLLDEAMTEYRYRMKEATQNVDVMKEDPYCVLQVRGVQTENVSEEKRKEKLYRIMKEFDEAGKVKKAGADFVYNFSFKELKGNNELEQKLNQFWMDTYAVDASTVNMGEKGIFAGIAIEDGFQALENLSIALNEEIKIEEPNIYPIYFGSEWKDFVELGQILTPEETVSVGRGDNKFQVAGFIEKGTYSYDPTGGVNSVPFCMDYRVIGILPPNSSTGNEGLNNFVILHNREDSDEITDQIRNQMRKEGILGSIENLGENRERKIKENEEAYKVRLQFALFMVTVAFLFAAVVFVSNLLGRKREIGILYVCGFGEKKIFYMILIEHTGIVLGCFLITYMIRLMQINHYGRMAETFDALEWYQMMERIHGELFPWFAGVAVLLLLLASLIPYGLLRRMDPVTLLEEGTR